MTAATRPSVSVVMAVCDAAEYVEGALASLLGQTFQDFECIIVDDGSTDGSEAILARYAKLDARIRVYRQDHGGVIAALNKACRFASGEYLARMDADDVSLPRRLEKQVRFLDTHPTVGVCGTEAMCIDEKGYRVRRSSLRSIPSSCLRWRLLFQNPFVHPSIMLRRSILLGQAPFRAAAVHAEDYDLWARLACRTGFAVLPETLLFYRVHRRGVSVQWAGEQEGMAVKIAQGLISQLLSQEVSCGAVQELRQTVIFGRRLPRRDQIYRVSDFISKLCRAHNSTCGVTDQERRAVTHDAAAMLLRLALRHFMLWPVTSWAELRGAMSLDPLVLFSLPGRISARGRTGWRTVITSRGRLKTHFPS
jgi:glycosyltransferase involved in cell wall biosynthesis